MLTLGTLKHGFSQTMIRRRVQTLPFGADPVVGPRAWNLEGCKHPYRAPTWAEMLKPVLF